MKAGATQTETSLLKQYEAGESVDFLDDYCFNSSFIENGYRDTVISDNGLQFVSGEFKKFSMEWIFNHVTLSPYHS